jgi:hypothetical protein
MASHWKIDVDGVLKDFNDDLDFAVTTSFGTGLPQFNNLVDELPLQDGSIFQKQKVKHRSFGLQGSIIAEGGETRSDVHAKRQAIIKAVMAYPELISDKTTPRTLRYTGGAVDKEIQAYYDGGLSDGLPQGWTEVDTTIRFIAPDPIFYATSETATALDSNDSTTFGLVHGKVNGSWSNLGASGDLGTVLSIVEDDTYIYIGGSFTNYDGVGAADRIARYHKTNQTWSGLGSGLNGNVNGLAIAANGDLIAVGNFTNAGGVGAADYIAKWNGSAWSALGTPNSGATISSMNAVAIGINEYIYVGGDFTNLAGIGNADHIAYWDGSSWNAMGTGAATAQVSSLAANTTINEIYAGGSFTNMGGVANADGIAKWDGSAWSALGTGSTSNDVKALAIDASGNLYAGGSFTSIGGVSVNRVAYWNSTSWRDIGAPFDSGTVRGLQFVNSALYAVGDFQPTNTDITAAALYNGSEWTHLDIDLGSNTAYAVLFSSDNDLYIGSNVSTAINHAGDTTISYGGTWPAYPYIEINRSGGTSATIKSIRNETTGAIIYCSYDLADGEKLTFEFRAQEGIGVTSDYFGSVPNAILSNSDTGNFYLTPQNASGNNDNIITVFVDTAGSPTITSNIKYKTAYISLD